MPEIRYASRTDAGRVREINEDSLIARQPLFLVADGMGGHEAGDLASQTAIRAFDAHIPAGEYAQIEEIATAYAHARLDVADLADTTERGAGCTLTGAVLVLRGEQPLWLVINIGDSRVYTLEGANLTQVTFDHTLRDEMLAEGVDPHDDRLPDRNMITRALGSPSDTMDTWLVPVVANQRVLICSDGLHGEISDDQIHATLLRIPDTDGAADELLRLALDHGGSDNISLVLIDVLSAPETPSDDATEDTLDVTRDTVDER